MTREEWMNWLATWLKQHPVRELPEVRARGYSAEVMQRIRLAEPPAPQFRLAVRPRLSWVLATVAACAFALMVMPRMSDSLTQRLMHDWQALEQMDEPVMLEGDDLEETLRVTDRLMLAEAPVMEEDAASVDQMLEVLEQLGEQVDELDGPAADEEWMDEMRLLDQAGGAGQGSASADFVV
jgi:hypothetical protein